MNRAVLSISGILILLSGCASPDVKAIRDKNVAQLQQILSQPKHGNEDLNDLIMWAATNHCAECLRDLFQAGGKVSSDGGDLVNANLDGTESERMDVTRLLIERGADSEKAIA